MLGAFFEIIGIVILFSSVLLLAPIFSGCFVLMFILILLSGLLIFFSIHILWIIVLGVFLYLTNLIVRYYKWYKLPTFNTYLNNNPDNNLHNIACKFCHFGKPINMGLFSKKSKYRYYMCKICGKALYRFTVL